MQDSPEGTQPHRHDEVLPDGVWYDHVDQTDCSNSPVIAALPELRSPVGTSPPCVIQVAVAEVSFAEELVRRIDVLIVGGEPGGDG